MKKIFNKKETKLENKKEMGWRAKRKNKSKN